MQSLDVFLSRLVPKVPGCPDPLARQALIDSAIEFCEETLLIQATSDPQSVDKGVGVYDLDVPPQQAVASTLKVWYGTTPLNSAASEVVDKILAYVSAAGDASAPEGTPTDFYEFAPGQIGIYPTPDESAPLMLSARVATKPLRTATALDDILYNDWVEAIVAGAVSRLCSIPGQFFTSADLALQGEAKFRYAINRAISIRVRGRVSTSVSVTSRSLA